MFHVNSSSFWLSFASLYLFPSLSAACRPAPTTHEHQVGTRPLKDANAAAAEAAAEALKSVGGGAIRDIVQKAAKALGLDVDVGNPVDWDFTATATATVTDTAGQVSTATASSPSASAVATDGDEFEDDNEGAEGI